MSTSVSSGAGRLFHRMGFGVPYPHPGRGNGVQVGPRRVALDFALIGAQKAGSTFLHHAVQHHPSLYMPVGEIPVFESGRYFEGALDWLDGLLDRAPPGALRGIKRPDYLGRPESPELLARHAPDAKLVVVLREPVSRTLSAYYHYMRRGHLPALHPDEGVPRLLDGALDGAWPRAWEVLAFSRYGECLERYVRLFGARRLSVLTQEEVIGDPAGAVAVVYRHLGVDPDFEPPGLGTPALPTVYSLPRVRFLARAQRLRGKGSGGSRHAGLIGRLAYLGAMGVDRGLLKPLLGNTRPKVSEAVRERLTGALESDRPRVLRYVGERARSWYC